MVHTLPFCSAKPLVGGGPQSPEQLRVGAGCAFPWNASDRPLAYGMGGALALLKKKKVEVIMTREEDRMMMPEDSSASKAADMKKRVELINKETPQIAVSIHQNSYQDPSVRGAQVFYYSGSKEGEEAAGIMQNALLSLDAGNTRQPKANDTYYLLRRTQVPTIIVECGFLSNPEEAANLSLEEYQDKVAEAICQGILEFIRQGKSETS